MVGEKTLVPDGCEIGKNVVIDSYLTCEQFDSLSIGSGGSVLKGGASK